MNEKQWANVLQVQLGEAAPNKMFTEAHRKTVRFLHYTRAVECAECGRRSKHHWTSLLSFKAMDMSGKTPGLILRSATNKIHPPLTPVCGSHPLAAAEMPPLPKKKKKKKIPVEVVRPVEVVTEVFVK